VTENLADFTDSELEQELELRKRRLEYISIPLMKLNIDFTDLKNICQEYITTLSKAGYADEDLKHYIFEAAIEACFGEDVWKWINSRQR
jgi:hypothetical protein